MDVTRTVNPTPLAGQDRNLDAAPSIKSAYSAAGSAVALGASGRKFEPCYADQVLMF